MNFRKPIELAEPKIIDGKTLLLAGLSRSYSQGNGNHADITNQWQEFGPFIANIPARTGFDTYGVIHISDEQNHFNYLSAVEVKNFEQLPKTLSYLRINAIRYAVFHHSSHVSEIQATCKAIWSEWLPASDYQAAESPFFERYSESFDPKSGEGGLEVWLPIKR